jgi:hypothetical protein
MKDEKSKITGMAANRHSQVHYARAKEQKGIRAHEQKLLVTYALMTYALILTGCARQSQLSSPKDMIVSDTGKTKAIQIAEDVLTRMHFTIDKFDPNSGFIKTRPLPGAQFFELWRSDNIGTKNWINSNLHSIRRTAEININQQTAGLDINCIVKIQRLSLPAREVTSSARVYQMFSISGPALQTLQLHPEQQERMAWIDLGRDTELENEILKRIHYRLGGASFILRPSSIGEREKSNEEREATDERRATRDD